MTNELYLMTFKVLSIAFNTICRRCHVVLYGVMWCYKVLCGVKWCTDVMSCYTVLCCVIRCYVVLHGVI